MIKNFKHTFLTFIGLSMAITTSAFTKEITLKGLVQDTSHNNLPGVTVTQDGFTESTLTDDRGEFTLKVKKEDKKNIILKLSKDNYITLKHSVKKPEKLVEPHLTPILDNNGIIAGSLQLPMTHAIYKGISNWLLENDRNKNDKTMDDGLFEKWKEHSGFKNRPPEQVRYRLRLPEKNVKIKGAFLISEHGMGKNMMENKIFWNFADKNDYALIGLQGNPIQRGIYPASKLEEIIAMVGKKYKHPELAEVPYMTFGHSNGTGFSAFYPALRPERTICWISYHSGGNWHLNFPGVELSPGLVMHGTKDQFLKGQDEKVMELRTKRNAPITMVMEHGVAHWPSNTEATFKFMADYCQANIDIRTKKDGSNKLVPLDEVMKNKWLGTVFDRSIESFQKPEIAPAADYKGDKKKANYLPNENFAKIWQRFRATGK